MEVLIKLLLAHFIADFFLQWPRMLKKKQQYKFLTPYLYLHGVLHGLLSYLFILDPHWLPVIGIIMVTHTIIDGLKLSFTNADNHRRLFFLDQLAHVVVIFVAWLFVSKLPILDSINTTYLWAHALCLFFVTFPVSICIQVIFMKWPLPPAAQESLTGAGIHIGYIERILIYIAVVSGNWILVGFLIAAKSVFRFGDFSNSDDRKYAEYLFMGTLLSLFFAILAGLGFLLLEKTLALEVMQHAL